MLRLCNGLTQCVFGLWCDVAGVRTATRVLSDARPVHLSNDHAPIIPRSPNPVCRVTAFTRPKEII